MLNVKEKRIDSEIDLVLEQVDHYIYILACKHMPNQITSSATCDLDVAELAQNARIKLWRALERGHIINVNAYVRSIVYHEAITMLRAHKKTFPLPASEEDELYYQKMYFLAKEEVQDPSYIIEQEELLDECAHTLADVIEDLPCRQQWAILCELKAHIGDILPILAHMQNGEKDILKTEQPDNKKENQRHSALLFVSRKKLRSRLATKMENK